MILLSSFIITEKKERKLQYFYLFCVVKFIRFGRAQIFKRKAFLLFFLEERYGIIKKALEKEEWLLYNLTM